MVEDIEGDYPTYVTQPSTGRVVPVVQVVQKLVLNQRTDLDSQPHQLVKHCWQVYKYSKYLGDLKLNFDNSGELLTPVDGVGVSRADVLLLDDTFPQDPWIEAQLEEYR